MAAGGAVLPAVTAWQGPHGGSPPGSGSQDGPVPTAHGIVPVVADGHWIWSEPPVGGRGYLAPRPYEASVGIQLVGTGPAEQIVATTPALIDWPEQKIDKVDIQTDGCRATIRSLSDEVCQLLLTAEGIQKGQTITAIAHYRLTLHKDYRGFNRGMFAYEQSFPKEFRRRYLGESPGIQTRNKQVRDLAAQITGPLAQPWDKAEAIFQWVRANIRGRIQNYTNVLTALKKRIGDCEERAAVFVALCRASGIPARLVWVPNHNWAEFYLLDQDGKGHWIPSHTSCYSWFGWTGAHEMVLQKGDNVVIPEKRAPERLLTDWMQWQGSRPQVKFLGELTPLPAPPERDAGPGARRKDERGAWLTTDAHPLDPFLRDGPRCNEGPPPQFLVAGAPVVRPSPDPVPTASSFEPR